MTDMPINAIITRISEEVSGMKSSMADAANTMRLAGQEIERLREQRTMLRDALQDAHGAINGLLARVIVLDDKFMPTRSQYWPAMVKVSGVLKATEGE